jgi:NADH-quinone oxidoreductase subunit G
MPSITINGKLYDFEQGKTILQVALENETEIPHYCYHPGLSIVANCRICLGEVWAPNARNDNKLEPWPKLVPTCQQGASDGMVVYTDSPKATANQKQVMEFLLINHPVDCPVCDQAGECHLQDYSYQYGRGESRFKEDKIKQPKKSVGPNVLLYSDRCIMCTRCVRFTREVTGTGELMVEGRGSTEQIDVFPGLALDNELASNVIDLCPVGALLDKDFLFQQRVWFLTKTPSIDGITSSGDNIYVEHNEGTVHRIKPRINDDVNGWWITDEVRYGWHFVHSENRLRMPKLRGQDEFDEMQAGEAWSQALTRANETLTQATSSGKSTAIMVSPMLTCEDAYLLGSWVRSIDPNATLAVGPVPFHGEDKTFPGGFTMRAEKCPNARGVRRVLEALGGKAPLEADAFFKALNSKSYGAVVLCGNYPSDWVSVEIKDAAMTTPFVLIDTLPNVLTHAAEVVLPGATWMEKSGTFENVDGRLQGFLRAIDPVDYCKTESQIGVDLSAALESGGSPAFDLNLVRTRISSLKGLSEFAADINEPLEEDHVESDMVYVDL